MLSTILIDIDYQTTMGLPSKTPDYFESTAIPACINPILCKGEPPFARLVYGGRLCNVGVVSTASVESVASQSGVNVN